MTIYAYTALSPEYPQYLSVNERGGAVEVTVRGPKKVAGEDGEYTSPGDTVAIALTREQATDLYRSLSEFLSLPNAA